MPSSYLLTNGLRTHYLHWNMDGGGQPVVLLHGMARNARHWEQVGERLGEAGLAVYAPDGRGHGLTDPPESDYSLGAFVGDVFGFCNALDLEQPVLAGHSWGAMVALEYAARFAVGPRSPRKVALVDGGLTHFSELVTWEEMQSIFSPPEHDGLPLEAYLAQLSGPDRKWRPDEMAVQAILADFEIEQDETIRRRVSPARQVEMNREIWGFRPYERIRSVRCPVLAVMSRFLQPYNEPERVSMAGKEAGVARIQEDLPGLQVHWMPNTGHLIPLERPDELAEILINFIRPEAGG